MPTDTFLKLSEEKKQKIISAAKKEFSRVPFEETSIKNIVEEAGIARGSFYQYFASKEELLEYMMENHMQKIKQQVEECFKRSEGDIFAICLKIYDYMTNEFTRQGEMQFYQKVFENIKTSQDTFFSVKVKQERPDFMDYVDKINTQNLKVSNQEDMLLILRMLYIITRKAIISAFKCSSLLKAREEYLKELNFLKYGVIKNKEGEIKC